MIKRILTWRNIGNVSAIITILGFIISGPFKSCMSEKHRLEARVYLVYGVIPKSYSEYLKILEFKISLKKAIKIKQLSEVVLENLPLEECEFASDKLLKEISGNIEAALETHFNNITLAVDSLVFEKFKPIENNSGYIKTSIRNKGNGIIKDLRFACPTSGFFELYVNNIYHSSGFFNSEISIGELRQNSEVSLKIWVAGYISSMELTSNETQYTFENGYVRPKWSERLVEDRFKSYFYNGILYVLIWWLIAILSVMLLLYNLYKYLIGLRN